MTENVKDIVEEALADLKGQDLNVLDVTELSEVMDTLVIVSGTSSRHVKSLANNVVEECKAKGIRPIGTEGMDAGEWVLVDYGDVVVHVMQKSTREFYDLEKLWTMAPSTRQQKD